MTTCRYDRVARRWPQFLPRAEWLKPDWPVPGAKVAIIPGRSSDLRFSIVTTVLKQRVELAIRTNRKDASCRSFTTTRHLRC